MVSLQNCVLSLFFILLASSLTAAIECRTCDHVATPGDCNTWTICGTGEICFAREFKEPSGKQAFNLGCEATSLCSLFLDVEKVGSMDSLCYNCCLTDDCNKDLCKAAIPKPTSPPKRKVCPEFYLEIYSKCYFFGTWDTTWLDARAYCKKTKYSDLSCFNQQAEHDQVNVHLARLAAPVSGYWLGGFYSTASSEWEWVDRTPTTYKLWESKYPPALNHSLDYYIILPRPVNGRGSKWKTDTREHKNGFICEAPLA